MIVADTNTLAYLLIEGERTPKAQALYEADPDWIVPRLWEFEFQNILATYARANHLRFATVNRIWSNASSLMTGRAYEVEGSDALAVAARLRISAYDAQFVSLAEQMNAPLITEDRALQRKAACAIGIQNYLDL